MQESYRKILDNHKKKNQLKLKSKSKDMEKNMMLIKRNCKINWKN